VITVYHTYGILFIAVSVKNVVDMSSNKNSYKHTHVRHTWPTPTYR